VKDSDTGMIWVAPAGNVNGYLGAARGELGKCEKAGKCRKSLIS